MVIFRSSTLIYYQQISQFGAMLQRNFSVFTPHLEGSEVHLSTNQHQISTIGSDGVIFTIDNGLDHTSSLEVFNQQQVNMTAFAMHPTIINHFAIGSKDGIVRYMTPLHQLHLERAQIIFKGDKPIIHVGFSDSGKYLSICFSDSTAVIYCLKSKILLKLPSQHEGDVNRTFFCQNQYVFSIGNEGKLVLYAISDHNPGKQSEQSESEDPFQEVHQYTQFSEIDRYKIAHQLVSKKHQINASYSKILIKDEQIGTIFAGGQNFLQIIEIKEGQTNYGILKSIKQEHQILYVITLGNGYDGKAVTIMTSTDEQISIWNFNNKEKIFAFNFKQELKAIITAFLPVHHLDFPAFSFLVNNQQSDSKIYIFKNYDVIDIQGAQKPSIEEPQQQEIKVEKQASQEEDHVENTPSYANALLTSFPQFPIEKSYEQYFNAKFLFYNNIGCVIERIEQGGSSTLELEMHDKSKPKRFNIDKNKSFGMFALKQSAFLCATTHHIVFQFSMGKGHFEEWQLGWENIQGVALGNTWIAVCNTQQIRIFDYCGNELHCICFDRRFVTIQAYQDTLAIVYHSSVAIYNCQVLKMRIYKITSQSVSVDRDVPVVLTPYSVLKWFGFSEEGMIFCQDSKQNVRGYSFNRNQWQIIFSLAGKLQRLFIQHVEGANIYGFKLQHKEGEKQQPKVLPRSLPRKMAMEWPQEQLQYLSEEQWKYLKKLMLKNYLLQHESYRHEMWYKYKYSRKKDHPWFEHSKTINSEEEIKTTKMQIDIQLHDYLKKFLKSKEISAQEYPKMAMSLVLICERQAHFEETKQKIRTMITTGQKNKCMLPSYFNDITYVPAQQSRRCKEKLNEISMLEQMINLMQ